MFTSQRSSGLAIVIQDILISQSTDFRKLRNVKKMKKYLFHLTRSEITISVIRVTNIL